MHPITSAFADATPDVNTMQVQHFVEERPWAIVIVVALVLIGLAIGGGRYRGRPDQLDSRRRFTDAQRREGSRRAGDGRCEHKLPMWVRCRKTGTHADHIYPHSRGGQTTLSNLQMLCPHHNLAKSDKIPSALYVWRLERRRTRYFPAGVSPKVEWRRGRTW
ncbi:HNH endonuclease [Agromyces humi]|uniref:HNH endonuclease n=1 Tax=Agromyces humi TaxID=1766800 RepID=UPI00135A671B|nr:HNH endonuclease signature motif containing protein [Agromyces humi]